MVRRHISWIAVADGARARIFAESESPRRLRPVLSIDCAEAHKPSRELGTDRPGRGFSGARGHPHAMEPPQDRHRRAKVNFAAVVAAAINDAARRNAFDGLVLVAPARMLRALRCALEPAALDQVAVELARDLTKQPLRGLIQHIDRARRPQAGRGETIGRRPADVLVKPRRRQS